ncbi:MAG: hypothetical protein IPG50_00815 [Myxococcales bacterium]|nr:hypothetical protein [Myxococcales bacterium]
MPGTNRTAPAVGLVLALVAGGPLWACQLLLTASTNVVTDPGGADGRAGDSSEDAPIPVGDDAGAADGEAADAPQRSIRCDNAGTVTCTAATQRCCWRADASQGSCVTLPGSCATDQAALDCTTSLSCAQGNVCCVETSALPTPVFRLKATCRPVEDCNIAAKGILCDVVEDCAGVGDGGWICRGAGGGEDIYPESLSRECYPR